ncbi:hypothetical protein ACFLQL_00600 [Verrucomicrobiota bacterium]
MKTKKKLVDYIVYCQFTDVIKAKDRADAERKMRRKYKKYDLFNIIGENLKRNNIR